MMNGEAAEARPPRGIKRAQGEALDDDHRFAKRFNLLNIGMLLVIRRLVRQHIANTFITDNHAKLYIPVSSRPQAPIGTIPQTAAASSQDDVMQVDETKDRVYIHNLDDELADIEPDEEKVVFLPDIEKQLSKIPKHLLTGNRPQSNEGQELVLYTVPSSLSVPLEKDSVRKAIIEARQRARDKVAIGAVEEASHLSNSPETAHGYDAEDYHIPDPEDDPDAMEIE